MPDAEHDEVEPVRGSEVLPQPRRDSAADAPAQGERRASMTSVRTSSPYSAARPGRTRNSTS
ncbi:hypothetical protein [Clavibacter zhangzhiyongii]|uniref:hypothetical protein n=1 Tax=Clavibacter zhangzhiyongii TaxID=2768071 RepID=UPI0039E16A51